METQEAPESTSCPNCQAVNAAHQKFCSQCSFPFGGTEEEIQSFNLTVSSRQRLLSDARDKINSAKNIIYFLAGAFFVFGVIFWAINDDLPALIVNLVLCLLYLIFAAWSNRNPFGALLTAFIVYLTVIVINAFADPTTIMSGIILKIVFIGALIKGIRSAREAQHYVRELEKYKVQVVGND